MRIAIVSELYPPINVGGAEVSAKYLAEALARDNDVIVVTPNYGRATEVERNGNLVIHRFGFPDVIRNGQLPNKIMGNPVMAFAFFFRMKKVLDDFRPDIIHAQNSLSFFPVSLYSGARRVATLRDYATICDCGLCSLKREFEQHNVLKYIKMKYRWQPSIGKLPFYPIDYIILKMKQYTLKRMDGVVCVSEYVRSVYSSFLRKSAVIYNIGKFETLRKKAEKEFPGKVVLYVGKVSVGKGTRHFLETIKIVSQSMEDVTFVIVGDGPMKEEVAEFSKRYKNVIYLGKLSHDRVLEMYSSADMVCSTSYSAESLSRVQIEALSLGVPCVATDVGGAREIIEDGVNGFLVEPGNPGRMAEKIEILLSDSGLRKKFSRNGIRKIKESFDEKKIVEEYVKFYRELLEQA